MQFTAITMVTFADVTPAQRQPAAVVSALTQQLGMGMGVAVGAVMLNASQAARGAAHLEVTDFRAALVLAGLMSALAFVSYRTLARDAGNEISGYRSKPATV
jgi:hypothetical protein